MKGLFKKVLVMMAVVVACASALMMPVYATSDASGARGECRQFLGMKSWDCGIDATWKGEDTIVSNIEIIATNVFDDILAIAGYLVLGFIVYGGYLYIFASGDVGKTQNGKKTLFRAFIGLAIILLAKVAVNSMHFAFLGSAGAFSDCATTACVEHPEELITSTLNWFTYMAGIVAVVYVVIGGIGFLTSQGDPAKVQKSKNTLLYSLIGLAVVILAGVLTNAFFGAISAAGANAELGADTDLGASIITIVNNIVAVLAVVAVAVIIIAGATYMTSRGNAEKAKKARDAIIYAAVGLLVCGVAGIIVSWAWVLVESSEKAALMEAVKDTIAFIPKVL